MLYGKPEFTDEELEQLEKEYEEYCNSDRFEKDMRRVLGEEREKNIGTNSLIPITNPSTD